MTNRVFERGYADLYDQIYGDKDYERECDLLCELLELAGVNSGSTLLDLGCGTGNHALSLARRGYRVTGVDISPRMLDIARRKAEREGATDLVFAEADIRELHLAQTFDAAIMMFAVLSYQVENADVMNTLRAARRHLETGARLFFDVWYGPAVLATRPSIRVKVGRSGAETADWVRVSSGELDSTSSTCRVNVRVLRAVNETLQDVSEHHVLRYFFAKELELLLEVSGFMLDRLTAFPDVGEPPSSETWNVLGIARAI